MMKPPVIADRFQSFRHDGEALALMAMHCDDVGVVSGVCQGAMGPGGIGTRRTAQPLNWTS